MGTQYFVRTAKIQEGKLIYYLTIAQKRVGLMEFIDRLEEVLTFFDETQNISDKEILQSLFVERFNAVRESARGIYDLPDKSVSVRFTQNNKNTSGNASNTVIAIAKIFPRDEHPILSVMVTAGKNYVRIMNSSFINKIAHSSKNAAADRLRGSINYSRVFTQRYTATYPDIP